MIVNAGSALGAVRRRLTSSVARSGWFVVPLLVAVVSLTAASPAAAVVLGSDPSHSVYFIGDSYTAGFGFLGDEGGADSDHISRNATNAEMANNWYVGDNSLSDCKPPDRLNDRCSNNNYQGSPWNAGPWTGASDSPRVAYPYVIANDQRGDHPAQVEDWAVSGATPADWDPYTQGYFSDKMENIHNSWVVMTLGGNPLLSDYLRITGVQDGTCSGLQYFKWFSYYPVTPEEATECANQQWEDIKQAAHLLDVYRWLVRNGNHVLVLGYPMDCPWSFGNWQPQPGSSPGAGSSCRSQTAKYKGKDYGTSQWDQAVAVLNWLDDHIKTVVGWVKADYPGMIAYEGPSDEWGSHQADSSDPWFIKTDTWVHPNRAGHQQLALQAERGMCSNFHHWCGSPPSWG